MLTEPQKIGRNAILAARSIINGPLSKYTVTACHTPAQPPMPVIIVSVSVEGIATAI
jgi:hypothetical protein